MHKYSYTTIMLKFYGRLLLHCYWFTQMVPESEEKALDLLYEAVRMSAGRQEVSPENRAFSLLLYLFGTMTLRVSRSPGRAVDFRISQSAQGRHLDVREMHDEAPVRGPTLSLEKLNRQIKKFSNSKLADVSLFIMTLALPPLFTWRKLRIIFHSRAVIWNSLHLGSLLLTAIINGVRLVIWHAFNEKWKIRGHSSVGS
jgi:hypothetical protein